MNDAFNALLQQFALIRFYITGADFEVAGCIFGELLENVRDRLAHRVANLQELKLTDDQVAKIAEIRKEYRPKIQEAGNNLRSAVREEVSAIGDVLRR